MSWRCRTSMQSASLHRDGMRASTRQKLQGMIAYDGYLCHNSPMVGEMTSRFDLVAMGLFGQSDSHPFCDGEDRANTCLTTHTLWIANNS
jgi:hypothetical protein